MTAGLLDHLWQSTIFAGGAALLTLTLRRNPARLRFRLWFAASLKFLVPFAALSAAGESLSRLYPATVPRLVLEIQPAAERLSAPARGLAVQHAGFNLIPVLACVWTAGFATVAGLRLMRWFRLRAVMRQARDLEVPAPVDVKASASLLEPGLVGILKPVMLLPEGLMPHLSKAERDAILAHELCHFSSGDNITAAIHMLVEALFWFYPPVWLIGARLIAERERACDESVLAAGHDAEVYAQGILKVCRFCVQSPLACASGASGADLGRRMRQIMSGESVLGVKDTQKALLAAALATALVLPVAEGFVATPPLVVEVQQRVAAVKSRVAAGIVRVAAQAREIATAPEAPVRITSVKIRRLAKLKAAAAAVPPQARRLAVADSPPLPPQPPGDAAVAPATSAPAPVSPPATASPAVAVVASLTPPPATPVKAVLVALYPQGNGDPDGVTCRLPEALPGSRLPGPRVCRTNRQWASLRARHEDITPDGEGIILRDGSEQRMGFAALSCSTDRIARMGPAVFNAAFDIPANACF